VTPFKDGILGAEWIRFFKKQHLELTLRRPQALDQNRTRNLCPETVTSFYNNLEILYSRHDYESQQVWNCDESGAQAGREGGGFVIAKRGCRSVHKVTPDHREWITVVSCINARGEALPNFYVFKGKRKTRNYLTKTREKNAAQAMQTKAWMTKDLFMEWMYHFFFNVSKMYEIFPTKRHVLILDGHGSHVTIDVIKFAMSCVLDGYSTITYFSRPPTTRRVLFQTFQASL